MKTSNRREFLGSVTAGGAAAVAAARIARAQQADPTPGKRKPGARTRYDVIIFGGGPAGIMAACQAGRAGAKTLLVEKNGMLGGTTTSGGVNFPGLFHAWGEQIIAGIGWELVVRTVEEAGGSLPDFDQIPDRHWQHQVRVDRALYAMLADEFVVDSGVEPLFHAMPAAIEETDSEKVVHVCTKTGLRELRAHAVVDCTGDANVLALAGCELESHDEKQPGTLMVRISGYDLDELDRNAVAEELAQAIDAGLLDQDDLASNQHAAWRLLTTRGDNAIDVVRVDGRTSEGRTDAELRGRHAFLGLYRFLRTLPACHHMAIDFMAPECGIRETVTIRGEATVTRDDYTAGRIWPDAVCNSFYPIDWHRADGAGIEQQHLAEGAWATIPRGAMIPAGHENLLAAGRCIASDQLANSALRVQATSMAVGQAAGALAALAAKNDVDVRAVPMSELRTLLRAHKAIVPEIPQEVLNSTCPRSSA
ncbi:MAG: FAD-dependent oxidoreductase [Candidatus Hydrogenedentota bacterium]